jgi:hypothetical protein
MGPLLLLADHVKSGGQGVDLWRRQAKVVAAEHRDQGDLCGVCAAPGAAHRDVAIIGTHDAPVDGPSTRCAASTAADR